MTRKTAPKESVSLDRYEVVEVHRRDLKSAPYNPRVMADKARDKLKRGIKKIGMLSPPTWNKRTGNIVGGHQRLSVLDAIHGSTDYTLKVAVVDLDEKAEKEANVLLNNPQSQGDWDLEKLSGLFRDDKLDVDATGFDMADIYRMFGDSPMSNRTLDELDEVGQKVREAQRRYDGVRERAQEGNSCDFYMVVVFRDDADMSDFLSTLGLENNRFQDGRELRAKLTGVPIDDDGEEAEAEAEAEDE